jgi:hypothetical protein
MTGRTNVAIHSNRVNPKQNVQETVPTLNSVENSVILSKQVSKINSQKDKENIGPKASQF